MISSPPTWIAGWVEPGLTPGLIAKEAMVIVVTGRLADGRAARVGVERERIVFVEPFESAETASQPAAETAERPPEHSEAPLPWILPGMVDIQVNGYAGLDVNAEHLTTDVVHDLVRAQWAQGVTAFLPTLITAPPDHIVAALRVIAQARSEDSMTRHSVPGVHVEGPYLSRDDGPRGAHDPAHIRTPDLAELARWCDASEGAIRVITLAPEAPGALALITAHQELENVTVERELARFKRTVDQRWGELAYDGLWSSPLKKALDGFIEDANAHVSGEVRMTLHGGRAVVNGRRSEQSLYDFGLATYDTGDTFDQSHAKGFIELFGMSTKLAAVRDQKNA
jgi:hypothetical protein